MVKWPSTARGCAASIRCTTTSCSSRSTASRCSEEMLACECGSWYDEFATHWTRTGGGHGHEVQADSGSISAYPLLEGVCL